MIRVNKEGRESMRLGTLRFTALAVAAFGTAVAISACGSSEDPNTPGTDPSNPNNTPGAGGTAATAQTPAEQVKTILDGRKLDYGEAARSAKLKLNDELPDLVEINSIANAADDNAKKAAYEKLIDTWMDSPKFASTMVKFWKDTFRTGAANNNPPAMGNPDLNAAANFAARVTVESKAYTDILTATTNTCPTFDPATNTFTDGTCTQTPTVGVLTDPGLMAQYISNMAFRRSRFVQETFACAKFPAEFAKTGTPMGAGTYTSPWKFDSIVGKANTPTAKIDFLDTQAVICANCHENQNRLAVLFTQFDAKGLFTNTSQVEVPIPNPPKAVIGDYLVAGESPAWRMGKPVTDIAGLGAAMAADPDIAKCAVNRAWNYAMSRGDIVNDLASVPDEVTAPYVTAFTGGGLKLKEAMRSIFKSEDFTKF